ncbi:hypothetical protein [Saccharopolyspora sp. 5N708]|uniref:hypothetical protein n=1 Tax=Saccharopolyspora sp. 5N708 TaxID=3457424 RepID=UPI003FD54A0F
MLEWYQSTIDSAITSGLIVSAIMFGLMCLRDWGIGWMGTWSLWIFVLAPLILWPLWILAVHSSGISAGADWLAIKKGYIRAWSSSSPLFIDLVARSLPNTTVDLAGFAVFEDRPDRYGGAR